MNRRTALKQVLIISAGAAIIPACMQDDKPTITLKKIRLSGKQEKLIAALSAAIIPSSKDFYGAAEIKAHEFAVMMVDDCEAPELQKAFEDGLNAFEMKVKNDYKDPFDKLPAEKKNDILAKLESKNFGDDNTTKFYSMMKNYTILAFTTSEKYMTDIRKYKMVPGSNFKGCVVQS